MQKSATPQGSIWCAVPASRRNSGVLPRRSPSETTVPNSANNWLVLAKKGSDLPVPRYAAAW